MKQIIFLLASLLVGAMRVYAIDNGNVLTQEVADVVFRQLDKHVQSHSAIYIGQTNKNEPVPGDPINHTVIEMAGIPNGGTYLVWVTSAAG